MKIVNKNSPNHFNGRFGWDADIWVCHQTGGTSAAEAIKYYTNPAGQVSPHDVIDTDGTIYHLVDYDDAAYCNGTQTTEPKANNYYKASTNRLVKSRGANANFYTYSTEFVHCALGDITEAQIQAAIWLLKNKIIPHAKSKGVEFKVDREHIIGHGEISPATRAFCPGKNFPFERIIKGTLGESYTDKPCKAVYESYGTAAIRVSCHKSDGNLVKRCQKGLVYPISGTVTVDGVKWLRHADGAGYSMYKDELILFKKIGAYKEAKTTARLNVRKTPEIASNNILGVFDGGSVVYLTGTAQNGWYPCIYKGQKAYVSVQYIKEAKS